MQSQRINVPPGQIASVVTYLEMRTRPELSPSPQSELRLAPCPMPELDWYRNIYRRIGAEWLWFSRLTMPAHDLAAALAATEVYVLRDGAGKDIGLLELDRREAGDVEIAFFGVIAEATGTGAAQYLIQAALQIAWQENVDRVWLHTCTLDHPAAVKFYRKAGFQAYKRVVEIDDDPRLSGALPLEAGAHAPPISNASGPEVSGKAGK